METTSRKTDFVRTSSGPKLRHRFVELYLISFWFQEVLNSCTYGLGSFGNSISNVEIPRLQISNSLVTASATTITIWGLTYLTHVDLILSCTWDDMYYRTYLLLQSALTVSYATNAVFKVLLHKHLHAFITWFPTYSNTWISIIGKQVTNGNMLIFMLIALFSQNSETKKYA